MEIKGNPARRADAGPRPSEGDVAAWQSTIKHNWHGSAETIFSVAEVCFKAHYWLSSDKKKAFVEGLPFGKQVFNKLGNIGADKRLQEIRNDLPPSYSTWDILRKLDYQSLDAAKQQGLIKPNLTRIDLQKWVKARNPKAKPSEAVFIASIRSRAVLDKEQLDQLWAILDELPSELGLIFSGRKPNPPSERAPQPAASSIREKNVDFGVVVS